MAPDYRALSLPAVCTELETIARDAQATFGSLDEHRLNWKPDATRWSVAQCFDHLLIANQAMLKATAAAVDPSMPRTFWQRLPLLPGVFGPMLVRSQAPETTRKFKAPRVSSPSSSAIDTGIVARFAEQSRGAAKQVRDVETRNLGGITMVSPFVSFITYSVLDGCRLMVAHDRRHFEQARRVTQQPEFPA